MISLGALICQPEAVLAMTNVRTLSSCEVLSAPWQKILGSIRYHFAIPSNLQMATLQPTINFAAHFMEPLEENAFGSKIAQPLTSASQLIQMTSSWHVAEVTLHWFLWSKVEAIKPYWNKTALTNSNKDQQKDFEDTKKAWHMWGKWWPRKCWWVRFVLNAH